MQQAFMTSQTSEIGQVSFMGTIVVDEKKRKKAGEER